MKLILLVWPSLALSLAVDPESVAPPSPAPQKSDLQKLDVKRYGVAVEFPKHWKIVQEATEDRAFVALLKQDDADRPAVVACEIGVPPSDLKEYHRRIAARDQRGGPGGKLIQNEIKHVAGRPQLESVWEFQTRSAGLWRELKLRILAHEQLYTFTLNAQPPHFERYRPAFETMARSARLSPPDTGLDRTADGYLIQRRQRFALRLPDGWRPSFSPTEDVSFFAVGDVHEVFANSLLVVRNEPQELNFERLVARIPEDLKKEDPNCRVVSCKTVPQGARLALETVVETQRGPFKITVLERRFRAPHGNYEVKFTLRSEDFDKLAEALRKSADSFKELPD